MLKRPLLRGGLAAAALVAALGAAPVAFAKDVTVSVWAGGTSEPDHYRIDAIKIAAEQLEREAQIDGEDLKITVEGRAFNGWDEFKQAFTLAAQSGTGPNILVTGHEDIATWSQSGLIRPIENYVDFDAWPLSDLYPNLVDIASLNGTIYGVPQDAESRPFFAWIPHLKQIGWSEAQIASLPERVANGEYTLYDMLADAKKMQDAGVVEPGYGFYPRNSNGPDYWQFYTSFGGEIADPETGKLVFDRAAMQRTYKFFADAVAMGVTKKNHIGMPGDQWWHEVATGKAGFWHGGTWHFARYTGKEGNKDFFGTTQFSLIPAGDKGIGRANTLTHPLVYLVTAKGDEAEATIAARLIAIASEPRINVLHAISSAHLAISQAETTIPLYSENRWAAEATERLLATATAMPNHSQFSPYWDIYWKGLLATWTGEKTPDQAVAEAEAAVKEQLGDAIIIR
ncbi:ABC transporter substrate-binding protein [Prosthecomicrobium pneumaticum]|uniref:Inositol-phosphate transport system substrate-binding protein n=1 Tax=Prosthecomicrobium pneumaticum TaxID=81895 RepID=A0A7W9CUP2_9HYPH|nr:extracellular solute-binding protein [Prosthecomicrobium pneumaticum]MBB5752258.1 inositol-phosphate transport system substrate-binding protein [Prosthecomicrobium pneumaticum]